MYSTATSIISTFILDSFSLAKKIEIMTYINTCKLESQKEKTIRNQLATKIPQNATNPGLFLCQTIEMIV